MSAVWAEPDETEDLGRSLVIPVDVVLDVGSGIAPQDYLEPTVHICVDPHLQCLLRLRRERPSPRFVLLNGTWDEALRLFPADSVDTVFAFNFIEHLEKDAGHAFLAEAERVTRRHVHDMEAQVAEASGHNGSSLESSLYPARRRINGRPSADCRPQRSRP